MNNEHIKSLTIQVLERQGYDTSNTCIFLIDKVSIILKHVIKNHDIYSVIENISDDEDEQGLLTIIYNNFLYQSKMTDHEHSEIKELQEKLIFKEAQIKALLNIIEEIRQHD